MGGNMAKVARRTQTTGAGEMSIRLHDPGMSAMHRAGLAGLWMTLAAIDGEAEHVEVRRRLASLGLSWALSPQSVRLEWNADPTEAFRALIEESFRLTEDGRFWFLALGHPDGHGDAGTTMQDALLNTFLQHGRTRRADARKARSGSVVLEVGDEQVVGTFRRVTSYAHRDAAASFRHDRRMKVVGWQFPGGAMRHVAHGETVIVDEPAPALALLYAPVGAVCFRIRRRSEGIRQQFCIAVPDVADLEEYSHMRRYFARQGLLQLSVAGSADAALRVMAELGAAKATGMLGVSGCHVMSFGVAPWASQQKTRLETFDTGPLGIDRLTFFRRAAHLFPAMWREPPPRADSPRAADGRPPPEPEVSPVLDQVARNVVAGAPWWRGFSDLVTNAAARCQMESYECLRRKSAGGKSGGIVAMVNQPSALDAGAETVVRACHEAWRRRMGALADRGKQRGEPIRDLISRERERLRIGFAHCKNASTLRAELTDFWSRAGGSLPELQRDWQRVLPYLREERWQEARDLALLALASYSAPAGLEDDQPGTEGQPEEEGQS